MTEDIDRFVQLCEKFAEIDLFGSGPPSPPYGNSPTRQAVKEAIEGGAPGLPQSYRDDYVAKLLEEQSLSNALRLSPDLLEAVSGAVYQHAPASEVQPQLQRFLAVISHLYHSFTSQAKGEELHITMATPLPPLALFQHSGINGPFTVPSDSMKGLTGTTIGVVSLPSAYRDYPVLWASLAHEAGGHDVKHATGGLLLELQQVVRALFDTDPLPSDFLNITPDQIQGILWSYWIDESAADVYGLLNMGPTYALNFSSYLAALRHRSNPGAMPIPSVLTRSIVPGNKFLDSHPTDILRLYLAIGVIENLNSLSMTVRDQYITILKQIAQRCTHGATEVSIWGFVPIGQDRPEIALHLSFSRAMEEMQDVARRVGACIATAQLHTLTNHSIQYIETWDGADELIAQQISIALQSGASVVSMGNDTQLLAGATLALLADAQKFTVVNERLAEALDHSYTLDPTWGTPAV